MPIASSSKKVVDITSYLCISILSLMKSIPYVLTFAQHMQLRTREKEEDDDS